jgi:hypothetical protein
MVWSIVLQLLTERSAPRKRTLGLAHYGISDSSVSNCDCVVQFRAGSPLR